MQSVYSANLYLLGTPLLWRGWGRSPFIIILRHLFGTPLLWRGWWGTFYHYPLSSVWHSPPLEGLGEVPFYRYLPSSIRGLQQFGVIPFEIRILKIGHTEQRRIQRFYIVAIVRHRGTVGAWRNRGYLRGLLMFLSTSLQSSGLQDFLKCLWLIRNMEW